MCKKISQSVRRRDLFAIPVQLTYKGQRKFHTLLGGFCTVILTIAAVVSLPIMIIDGIYNPDYS